MTLAVREPIYVRIAADLRRRIQQGSLGPGQRVPSTRRLAKTWKVALATAGKALDLPAQQGAIVAIPRVGSVVAGPAAREVRKTGDATSLGRAAIVRAAIDVADREGLDALSMRGVAAKMGVPVTSLYRHVARKEDLVRAMVDAVMTEQPLPSLRPRASWRARLESGARVEWQLMRLHPWVARVMTLTRPLPTASSLRHADWMLSALDETGADASTIMQMHVAIYAYVQGLATNVDTEAQAEGETGLDEATWLQAHEHEFSTLARSGAIPTFARILGRLEGGFDLDLDRVFEFGLALLLDGFAARLSATKRGRGRRG